MIRNRLLDKVFSFALVAIMLLNIASVNVVAATKKPKLNKSSITLEQGKTFKLKVAYAKNKKVTWKSNHKTIVKVSGKGKITALKEGKAKITAKVGKKKLICKVTVKKKSVNQNTTEKNTQVSVDVTTERRTEVVVDVPTEERTEESTKVEDSTEDTTEKRTESTTEVTTEERTEGTTEVTTEEQTEGTTEVATEERIESTTEVATEERTEATTEVMTEAQTEITTEMTTEATTEITTEITTEELVVTPPEITYGTMDFYFVPTGVADQITLPEGYSSSNQITVTNATSVSYVVIGTSAVSVDKNGLASVDVSKAVGSGAFKIRVNADGTIVDIPCHIYNYYSICIEEEIRNWVSENVTDDMSDAEKLATIQEKVMSFPDQQGVTTSALGLWTNGSGDCLAHSALVNYMAYLAGYDSWYYYSGRSHRSSVVYAGGYYYRVEADGPNCGANKITEKFRCTEPYTMMVGYRNLFDGGSDNILLSFFGKTQDTYTEGLPEENIAPLIREFTVPEYGDYYGEPYKINYVSTGVLDSIITDDYIELQLPKDIPFGKDTTMPNGSMMKGGYQPLEDSDVTKSWPSAFRFKRLEE